MRIAVVGTGVAGLVASYLLSREHEVTAFEADDRVGGHVHTVDVEMGGRTLAVDTGFIVYNERTYPLFTRLLRELGVETQPTEMSFSVACESAGLEYATHSLAGLFATRRSTVDRGFHRMLLEIVRFGRRGRRLLDGDDDESLSLAAFLQRERFSQRFLEHYIVPMGAAIWSADPARFLDFPARTFAQFFENHGLLDPRDNLRWRVIRGGSRTYVDALVRRTRARIHTSTPVLSIRRHDDGVRVLVPDGATLRFDHVIVACHGDHALRLLHDRTDAETDVLGSVAYQPNDVVLHTDASIMPSRKAAWASWNYRVPRRPGSGAMVTYDMNRLQGISSPEPLLVTLNDDERIDPARVLRRFRYEHPVYDARMLRAQKLRAAADGTGRTHFCGAYWGHGFHEDGVRSALDVCARFGLSL